MCPSVSRIDPDPEPEAELDVAEMVTTEGSAVLAAFPTAVSATGCPPASAEVSVACEEEELAASDAASPPSSATAQPESPTMSTAAASRPAPARARDWGRGRATVRAVGTGGWVGAAVWSTGSSLRVGPRAVDTDARRLADARPGARPR